MLDGLAQLKKGCAMARTERSVTLPNGQKFSWWQTPLTLAERERATQAAGKNKENPVFVGVQVMILKATNEAGQKLFQRGQFDELLNELPETVLGEIILELFRDSLTETDDEGGQIEINVTPKSSSPNSRRTAS